KFCRESGRDQHEIAVIKHAFCRKAYIRCLRCFSDAI
ncbi:hypothetical protein GGI1_10098, partial [Acidithiobacillus sp. GGI-221]